MYRTFWLTALCSLAVLAPTSQAQTKIHVDKDAGPGGDGSTWATAYDTLQPALDEAVTLAANSDILVAEGLYRPVDPMNPTDPTDTFAIDMGSTDNGVAIRLLGGFVGTELDPDAPLGSSDLTVLRGSVGAGNKRFHVVSIFDVPDLSRVTIDGFRIRNGWADGSAGSGDDVGAGLRVIRTAGAPSYGQVVVENVWFDSNWADSQGGAIFFDEGASGAGSHYLRNCRFTNNTAADGGGVRSDHHGERRVL